LSRIKFIVKLRRFIVVIALCCRARAQADDQRISVLREAVRAEPSSASARHSLAEELARAGDLTGAIRELEVALNLHPGVAEWQFLLGSCYLKRAREIMGPRGAGYHADLDRAAIALQRAADAQPSLPNVHNLLGWLRQEIGDFPAAVNEFRAATRWEPTSAGAFRNLGTALVLDQKPGDAVAAYQKAVELEPGFIAAHLDLDSALQQRGGREVILQDRLQAVRKAPGAALARAQLGRAYWMNDRFAEAAAELRRALTISPRLAIAHYYLGQTLRQLGDPRGAVQVFEAAARLKPECADCLGQLGAVQLSLGQVDAAVANLRKAVQLDGSQSNLHYQLGMALRRAGQTEESARELAAAAELKRGKLAFDQAGLHAVQGIAQLRQGKPREAVAELRQAVEAKPDYGLGHYYLGIALAQSKEYPEAVAAFERALTMRPQSAEIHYNFGIALWEMGERARAIEQFQRTVDLDAGHALARCALSQASGSGEPCAR
jgi:tetratricopeptide (TPR) repeat protein